MRQRAIGARAVGAHQDQRHAPCSSPPRAGAAQLVERHVRAPPTWPAANSSVSLTSTTTAFSRLMSCTAPCGGERRRARAALHQRPQQHARRRRRPQRSASSCRSKKFIVFPCTSRAMLGQPAILECRVSALRSHASPMHKLVLIRHGESTWNLENRFTGWTDVDLTAHRHRAGQAGRPAAARPRATTSTSATPACSSAPPARCGTCLDEMDRTWLPVVHSWRLNERHYGALQGLNKAETAKQVRRRAGAGLAPQLRHAAAGAGADRPAQRARRHPLRQAAARTRCR